MPESHRVEVSRALLLAGALLGGGIAAYGLVMPEREPVLPPSAVALVNGSAISRARFEEARRELHRSRGAGLSDQQIVDMLVDETLIVQRAIELGLAESDARVRAALVSALENMVMEADDDAAFSITEADLRQYYELNKERYQEPFRARVKQLYFAQARAGKARADAARAKLLTGATLESLRGLADDPGAAELAEQPLTATELIERLGPAAVKELLALEPGAVTQPIASGTGIRLLQLAERFPARSLSLEDCRPKLGEDFERDRPKVKVRRYLHALRAHAHVVHQALP